jgi:hypothetical protein
VTSQIWPVASLPMRAISDAAERSRGERVPLA